MTTTAVLAGEAVDMITQVQPGRQMTQPKLKERVVVMWMTKVGAIEARVRTLIEIPLPPIGESMIMILTPLFQIQRIVDLEIGLHPLLLRECSVTREPERVRPGPNVEGVDLHMHKDGDDPPQWARYTVESQLNSKARLVNLESEIRKAKRGRKENDAKDYLFEKKPYKDQYDFNKKVFEHLDRALHLVLKDRECGDLIRECMNLLKNRNKQLKITDRFGWKTYWQSHGK